MKNQEAQTDTKSLSNIYTQTDNKSLKDSSVQTDSRIFKNAKTQTDTENKKKYLHKQTIKIKMIQLLKQKNKLLKI